MAKAGLANHGEREMRRREAGFRRVSPDRDALEPGKALPVCLAGRDASVSSDNETRQDYPGAQRNLRLTSDRGEKPSARADLTRSVTGKGRPRKRGG
jgi:hypothetical protein